MSIICQEEVQNEQPLPFVLVCRVIRAIGVAIKHFLTWEVTGDTHPQQRARPELVSSDSGPVFCFFFRQGVSMAHRLLLSKSTLRKIIHAKMGTGSRKLMTVIVTSISKSPWVAGAPNYLVHMKGMSGYSLRVGEDGQKGFWEKV